MSVSAVPVIPKAHWFWGSMQTFSADALNFVLDARRYGDVAALWFGPYRSYIVNHPDHAHTLLVSEAEHYHKDRTLKAVMKPVLGGGIFLSDGAFWKRQRKLVQPAFHSKRIGAYAQVMVDYTLAAAQRWQSGQVYDVDREMTALTMNIVAKTLFDADVSGDAREVGEVITTVLELTNLRFNSLIPIPDWLPTSANRKLQKAVKRLDELIYGFINERRKSNEDKGDLLSMLLLAQDDDDKHMTDKQVRDEAMTLFGAGHETTAVALTWTWYLLAQHPEIEQKLLGELDRVLGGRAPTLADLPNLQYTEMILKESMRLYPPAWVTTREAVEDVQVGGYTLEKGSIILINIFGIQRDTRFFADPEAFRPERFSAENEKLIPKYAYIPFGGGPRVCIGNQFAMMEAKLILATLAQRFQLRVAPGHVVKPERVFTLRPKYGLRMVVTAREARPVP
ncbi:MAG: cytochrome P450 [Chloroflexi bacterium]|nr:cytochrome P450 [Chloroflexota bacterium]